MTSSGLTTDFLEPVAVCSRRDSDPLQWLRFAGMILIYKYLLDEAYEYIAYAYSYQNFFYDGRTVTTQALSWLMLVCALPAFKLVFEKRSASANILSLLILFSAIPTITAISFRPDYGYKYIILQAIFWSTFYAWWSIIKPIHFRRLSQLESKGFYIVTVIVLALSVITYSYINVGFRLHLDLIEVYDIRAEARGFIAPFPLNYLVSLADNILPVLAIFLVYKKRWLLAVVTFAVIFINFSIAGQKQVLFIPVLGLIGYYAFKHYVKTYALLIASIVLAAMAIMQNLVLGTNVLHGLFTYRVLFIPTELHFSYFGYFQSNDVLYYSQSILRSLADPSQENIQFIIGEYAIGEYTARANNGLFSDAYMNLGILGVLIYPLILSVLLRIFDGAMIGLPARMTFVVVLYIAFVLLGMTLTTALITSGLIFLVFLLYSFPREHVLSSPNMLTGGSYQPTTSVY